MRIPCSSFLTDHGGTAGLPIFKSWTTHRREAPTGVLATADYWHPNITPAFINAQIALNAIQGQNGIWFAGTHTYDVDSQESAIVAGCTPCAIRNVPAGEFAVIVPAGEM